MINYNPKDWFSLIFKFHKSDTFRVLLPAMFLTGMYSLLIAYFEIDLFHLKHKSVTVTHSLMGFVISMLLVFRTNTAYERWWEGRKLWGSLLNNSRNMAIKVKAILGPVQVEECNYFMALISNFGYALRDHLRSDINMSRFIETNEFKIAQLENKVHIPNHFAFLLFDRVNKLYKEGKITGEQLIVLNEELRSLTDICGGCERIKKTPIPYSYSLFLKKFIFIYVMTMPFAFVYDFGYWLILITMLVFYVLASLELIAEEIEDPFGKDANDLPVDEITANINKSTKEILLG